MNNIATQKTFTNKAMLNIKTSIFLAVFLFTSIIINPVFAQEEITLNNRAQEQRITTSEDLRSVDIIDSEDSLDVEALDSKPVKSSEVPTKEQQKAIKDLDKQLKKGDITQAEYDRLKNEVLGITPEPEIEAEALSARSTQVEPEAQTLGKHVAPSVSTSNGSLNYSYPIVVPSGRNGLTPDIALAYNSTNKSQSSLVGTGWSFNIPYIQRVNKTGTNNLYTEDHFISSLDGELVDQGSGIYTPRTENGSFLKYEYVNDTWTVTDKTGTTYEFGTTVQSRQDNPTDTTQIFSWMLETVTDTNSNTISYSYFKDQGQIYPDTISYNQSGLFDVVFKRVAKTTPNTAYTSAFKVTTSYLINEVEVSTDSSVTATYDISTTDNLVKDITVTGFEGSSSFELPPVEFEYTSEVISGDFQDDTSFNFPTASNGDVLDLRTKYYNYFKDINGDGLPDFIRTFKGKQNGYSTATSGNNVFINTGSGFIEDSNFLLPTDAYGRVYNLSKQQSQYGGTVFQDINGDGLPDFIRTYLGKQNGYKTLDRGNNVFINTGSGFVEDINFLLPTDSNGNVISFLYTKTHYFGSFFQDFNGDGLPDLLRWKSKATNSSSAGPSGNDLYINTGSGFVNDTSFLLPVLPSTNEVLSFGSYQHTGTFVGDINGDGLPDLIRWMRNQNNGYKSWKYGNNVFINTGTGFIEDTNFLLPTDANNKVYGFANGTDKYGSFFQDINADGLPDLIRWRANSLNGYKSSYHGNNVFINTGTGFVENTNYTLPVNTSNKVVILNHTNPGDDNYFFQDIDGNKLPDFVRTYKGEDNNYYHNTYGGNNIYLNTGTDFSKISKVISPQDGETDFEYTHARIQDDSNEVPFPVEVIESMTTDDNNGNTATTSYEYRDADYYFNTPTDKKFAGFGSVIKTTDDGTIHTTKYHQANGETGNEPTDSYAKIGKAYEQTVEDSSNNLFSRNRTNYTETNLGGISNSIQSESQLSMQYDGTSSHVDTATGYEYDNFGNTTKQTQYGVVSGNTDGTFSDTGSDKRTVEYTYTNNTTDYLVGLPTNQTLKNNNGTKEAETNYSYDTTGNLLTKSDWITGSDYSDTTYTYNGYGLPLIETDALNNTTTYAYDTENMYPASVTNALSQVTNYLYDYSSGKVTQITDPNGKVTSYVYDGLDRLLEIAGTIGNGGTQVLKDISYNTTATPQYSKSTTYTGTESQDSYSYTDGFGKTIQSKSEMDSGWLTLDTVHDDMGRVEKQSLPYETSSSANSNPTSNNDLLTSFTYDALGRVLSTVNTKGTTTTDYDGFETTITDAEGNQKDLITDTFGNLVIVKEHNDGSIYTTNYDYNVQNLLTKITDAESNVRNIDYDGLGRRTSLEDLHSSSDSTFGTWSFDYDDINLTSQIDPKGATTSYTYDDLNRMLTEDNSGATGTEITNTYDSCTNGVGNVCSITTPDISTNYTYLKQGLVDTETKVIDSVSYTTDTDYNRQGAVTKITHPNASYTEYSYNTRGMVGEVKYNGTSLATADYGVHGRPVSQVHTNGITSTLTYDDSELYELTNKTTTDGTTDFQDLSYSYDDVGNITGIVDGSDTDTAKTQSFTYDDLYRLTGTSVTNSANTADYSRSYSYSPIGNITAFDGTTYSYTDTGYSNPHAVTNIGGQSYIYDNNGNLTNDGTWTHSWDYRNRLTSSTDGTSTSSYKYDSNNQRIKLVEGSDTTVYPTGDYKIKNGDVKVSLTLGESLVATDDNGTINHVHTDHLGGTNITTDTTGVITQTLDYYPFGDTRIDNGTDNETKQFTGYTKDTSTGLNYAGARYYAGNIGRFISQDPLVLRLGTNPDEIKRLINEPQRFNTYAYALNNPVAYTDNNGEDAKVVIDSKEKIITLSTKISIHGASATKQIAQTMQTNINSEWNKGNWTYTDSDTGTDYKVNFDVSVKKCSFCIAAKWGTNNKIKVDNNAFRGSPRSFVYGPLPGNDGVWRDGTQVGQGDSAPHEFGHLIGLVDRYDDHGGAHSGHEGNIMAEPAMEGDVSQSDINTLFKDFVKTHNTKEKTTTKHKIQ